MRCRVALLALSIAAPLHAAQPRAWELRGPGDLLAGELSGLAFDAAGHVTLAPELTRLPDVGLPFVWSLCSTRGTLYAGTGNEGQVWRVRSGQAQPFFKAAELEIHALACAPDGRVFAGSSPDGKVYVVDDAGQAKPYFDPEGKYIWALALDPQGRLLVATGAPARLLRVDATGQATELLASPETHFTALAVDKDGRAYVGSAPAGLVYAVEGDGQARVLVDSDYREVKALGVRADGSVYAALFEGSGEGAAPAPTTATTPAVGAATGEASVMVTESFGMVVTAAAAGTTATPMTSPTAIGRGALLRLFDGDVETLWTSYEDAPFALFVEADAVLLGTGDKGRLLRVRDDRTWQLVTLLPAGQITALTSHADELALAGSNGGVLFTLAPRAGARGVFTSAVKDSGAPSLWGRLRLEARQREAGALGLETRSGNGAQPDGTWSAWRPAVERGGSLHADSPKGRYVQVRVTLTGQAGRSPIFDGLTLFYLPRNLRPEVTLVVAHTPGEVFQKTLSVTGEAEVLGLLEPTEEADPNASAANAAANVSAFSRKLRRRGLQTLSWRAQDANQDTLLYDVLYRPVESGDWRGLRTGLSEPVLTWDTSALPDGRYVAKVVARDTPSNAPEQALAGERESAPFDVDNTPPSLSAARLSGPAGPRVRVVALDRGGAVQRAQYSVDGQAWVDVHPLDGLADSPEETYEWAPVVSGGGSARTLMVRVTDQLGNVATAQVALR
jgi:hypothetical protein